MYTLLDYSSNVDIDLHDHGTCKCIQYYLPFTKFWFFYLYLEVHTRPDIYLAIAVHNNKVH